MNYQEKNKGKKMGVRILMHTKSPKLVFFFFFLIYKIHLFM